MIRQNAIYATILNKHEMLRSPDSVMCEVHIQPKVKPLAKGNVIKVKSDTGTSKTV